MYVSISSRRLVFKHHLHEGQRLPAEAVQEGVVALDDPHEAGDAHHGRHHAGRAIQEDARHQDAVEHRAQQHVAQVHDPEVAAQVRLLRLRRHDEITIDHTSESSAAARLLSALKLFDMAAHGLTLPSSGNR